MVKRSRQDSFSSSSPSDHPPPSTAEVSTPEVLSSSPPNSISAHPPKYTLLDESNTSIGVNIEVMRCSLPPHKDVYTFPSYEDYEVHYTQFHVNRCSECRKNFPTPHFLQLHIEENHDPLNEARKARGDKIYRCFVEDCERICSAPHKRRMHLVDKHMFPKDYNFHIVNDGIDKSSSMLRPRAGHRRHSSAAQRAWRRHSVIQNEAEGVSQTAASNATPPSTPSKLSKHTPNREEKHDGEDDSEQDSDERDSSEDDVKKESKGVSKEKGVNKRPTNHSSNSIPEAEMSNLTDSMSALRFIPPSIRFGRGRGRGGFRPR